MKGFQRLVTMLLALCLLLPSTALAELRRGDSGELVLSVQQRLQESGFLNDKLDGKFGKRTEQAVVAFQERYGYEPNGVLDDAQIHHLLNGADGLSDAFYANGAGADGRGVENYCYTETRYDGYSYKTTTTYCEKHAQIVAAVEERLRNGNPEDAVWLYEEEVMRLYAYELPAQLEDEDAKAYVDEVYGFFGTLMDKHMTMLEKWYGAYDAQLFQEKRAELLRSEMVFLCSIVNGESK